MFTITFFILPKESWTLFEISSFLGKAPTSMCHFFCPSVRLSIYHAQYFRNHTSSNQDFWHTCVNWWYLQAFFFFFFIFFIFGPRLWLLIFWIVKRVKGQKIDQVEKQLYLSCTISQEQYSTLSRFLVHLCKMISPVVFFFFPFFEIFIFWAVRV